MLSTFLYSIVLVGLIMGGPLTLFAVIKILNSMFGNVKTIFVKNSEGKTGLLVNWDERSFPYEFVRVKVDFFEMVPGGRSSSFSYTFQDSRAQKKSFFIPFNISAEDLAMFSDNGLGGNPKAVKYSYTIIELEKKNGNVIRTKVAKKKILEQFTKNSNYQLDATVNNLGDIETDNWSVLTRLFPWKDVVAKAEVKKKKSASGEAGPPVEVDFVVTKVWIEPGCIVCDACENEAPDVFHVTGDTCIVRDNAPLGNAPSIVAAAEGCPVDVIKFDTKPK